MRGCVEGSSSAGFSVQRIRGVSMEESGKESSDERRSRSMLALSTEEMEGRVMG